MVNWSGSFGPRSGAGVPGGWAKGFLRAAGGIGGGGSGTGVDGVR